MSIILLILCSLAPEKQTRTITCLTVAGEYLGFRLTGRQTILIQSASTKLNSDSSENKTVQFKCSGTN